MSSPFISVVIPTCDRPDALRLCLHKLEAGTQTYPNTSYEVIVSDDGHTISAQNVLGIDFPHVSWVKGPQRGPAANRNIGAAAAKGEVIVFLDDDCLPQPELLATYANVFTDSHLLAAEGRIVADRPRQRLDEEAPINEKGGVFWSCNIAIRTAFFTKIRGFDERFTTANMEDVELRERILRLGTPITFLPDALVIHPFRRMKGWSAIRREAKAHGIYILLPSCHLPSPSWRRSIWNTIRVIYRRFLPRLWNLRGRGWAKASTRIFQNLWCTWEVKKALRRKRQRNVDHLSTTSA